MYEEKYQAIKPHEPVQFSTVKARIEEREVRVDFDSCLDTPRGTAYLVYRRDHQDPDPQAVWSLRRIRVITATPGRGTSTEVFDFVAGKAVPWWLVQLAVQGKSYI